MQHATPPYGIASVPRSRLAAGRYGRMFRQLPALDVSEELLTRLALAMHEENVELGKLASPSNNDSIPAGYTYLGQFIDHDLTFEPFSRLLRDNDPDALNNFRTPRFDLDSLYGGGPTLSPHLYAADGASLVLDESRRNPMDVDLARNADGVAVIADPRNDENSIVSQLTVAMIRYHNRVVATLAGGTRPAGLFDTAAAIVRWHYQWIVLHDFLPRLVSPQGVAGVLRPSSYAPATLGTVLPATRAGQWTLQPPATWYADLRFFTWREDPYMPVEFSGAVFRMGHSMVRNAYALNTYSENHPIPVFVDTTQNPADIRDLRGGRRRLPDQRIEWRRFFNFSPDGRDYPALQPARAIDSLLAFSLSTLPTVATGDPHPKRRSLALRNLLRGVALGLPSGQAVARAMGMPESLILGVREPNIPLRLRPAFDDPSVPDLAARGLSEPQIAELEAELGKAAPLWYYVLKEAEAIGGGRCLGPVGGRIVTEVFAGILLQDGHAFLNQQPLWTPRADQFGCLRDGVFSMRELLAWAVHPEGR